jgi:2-furoyl-CoA dehydrogenase FAD binding subunit
MVARASAPLRPVKPPKFEYVRADCADEAIAVLREHGEDARILAGGQSLMPILNMRFASPRVLVDISRCADLAFARVDGGDLVVGAAVTQAAIETRAGLAEEVPLLSQALPHVGHFQTRNRGTVCGSIAHAEPSAELPLVLLALGGSIELRSTRGRRTLSADAFLQGTLMTAREPDELVHSVRFPLRAAGSQYRFGEVAMRHGDFALAAVACIADARRVRIAAGGVADRARAVEFSRKDAAEALNDFAWSLGARDDHHASARYRRHLVRSLGRELMR